LSVGLFEGEGDALLDVFGFGRRLDDHGWFFLRFSAEQAVEYHHAARQHRPDGAVALCGAAHHVRVVGDGGLDWLGGVARVIRSRTVRIV